MVGITTFLNVSKMHSQTIERDLPKALNTMNRYFRESIYPLKLADHNQKVLYLAPPCTPIYQLLQRQHMQSLIIWIEEGWLWCRWENYVKYYYYY